MSLLKLTPDGVSLRDFESPSSTPPPPLMIGLNLDYKYIEQMIQHVMIKGKDSSLQLCLGDDPKIIFGDMTQHLNSSYEPFSSEIYTSPYTHPPTNQSDTMHEKDLDAAKPKGLKKIGYSALMLKGKKGPIRTVRVDKNGNETTIDARKTVSSNKDPNLAGTDDALATLQATMADETARKSANTTKIVKGLDMKSKKGGNKKGFLGPSSTFAGASTRNSPAGSPTLTEVGSPRQAPTSAPVSLSEQQAERSKAIRAPIIHVLAAEPSTETRLHRLKKADWTEAEFQVAIDKVADKKGNVYVLIPKMYKELDVFKYHYQDDDDRQKAIDNAVKAYDKMRLETSAPEWERLLPRDERGTGKCLSKLQAAIATGTAKAPKINVQRPSDNTASGAESGADDPKAEATVPSGSHPPTTKHKKPTEKEAQAKRLLGKGGIAKATPKQTKKTSAKSEEKFLSSQYIEDSDEELDAITVSRSPNPAKSPNKLASKPATKPTAKKPASSAPSKSSAAGHKRNVSAANSSSGGSDTPIAKKWMSARKDTKKEKDKEKPLAVPTAATVVKALSTPNHHQGGKSSPMPKNPVMHHKRKSSDDDSLQSSLPSKKPKTESAAHLPTPAPATSMAGKRVPSPNAAVAQKTTVHRASDASSKSSGSTAIGSGSSGTGRPRSSTQKSSPLAMSPPTNASDLDASGESDRDKHYTSSSSTDKSAGTRLQVPARNMVANSRRTLEQPTKVLDVARKFKLYYDKYLKDYTAMEKMSPRERQSAEGKEKYDKLMQMHVRLAGMKKEIFAGYARS